VLAKAIEDDAPEEALQPLHDSLAEAATAKPEFDRMLATARRQFVVD
jgi:hypothetical protein